MSTIVPDEKQRAEILTAVLQMVRDHFYDPHFRGLDWEAAVERHRAGIMQSQEGDSFEEAVTALLKELNTSHIGFYHLSLARTSSKAAISATYAKFNVDGVERWVFQDVHEGGAAERAGIRPGHVLMAVEGLPFSPPDHPVFPGGKPLEITVLGKNNRQQQFRVDVPPMVEKHYRLPFLRRLNQPPHAEPKLVIYKRLDHEIGYVRVSMYPGMLGIDVANEVSAAVASLNPMRRLILDLRGNSGGGLAVLRIMSLLTPACLPVGYHLRRNQPDEIVSKNRFFMLNRIPESKKIGIAFLILKFEIVARLLKWIGQERGVMLGTQGLGPKPFHSRIVILTNRHTVSANEMLIAFAKENHLATIVGEATPGRLLGGDKFELPYGYRLVLPVSAYRTAAGTVLEGNPILPDIAVPFDPALALAGRDPQLEKAIEVVSGL